jgi:hypothetical protein
VVVIPVAPPVVVAPVTPVQEPPAPEPETPVEVVTIESIEQEVEAEIEILEVEEPVEETIDEAVEEPAEENNNEETSEEESSGDVEQPVGGDESEEKDTDNGGEDDRETSEDTGGDTSETKKPKLTAKQKAEAKKIKMKQIIKEKLSRLATVMAEAATLEQQAALQAQIQALINYVPGFNAYGQLSIPGRDFYQEGEFYEDKKLPENQRGLLNGLASELKWNEMVDEQYEGME